MPARQLDGLLTYLRRMVLDKSAGSEDADGQLLERYVKEHDELAFGALVRRHGTLVFGVARRVLQNDHDAEDVFQATFAILARKAATGSWRNSVAGWLYRVAFRMATRRRLQCVRQNRLEQSAPSATGYVSTSKADLEALYSHLDRELNLLPDNYRNPLLLCYLSGKTRDQAAEQLGWSLRTLERRLEQGLKLLRQRLGKHGVELSMTLLAAGLSQQAAEASISNALILSTLDITNFIGSASSAIRSELSSSVLTLVEIGLKSMAIEKTKVSLGFFAAGLATVIGACAVVYEFSGVNAAQDAPESSEREPKQNRLGVWLEGATVTGRVIDHKGAAVANAEVLMLGSEYIIVDANQRTWFEFPKRKDPPPPSTRTNQLGEFSITRTKGDANRLVIISTDPILWSVARKNLPHNGKIEIKLPVPSGLAIHTNLPGKPRKQSVAVLLESLEGGEWHTEMLRYQHEEISVPNPGETIIEHLPPGKYAVQREIFTPTDPNSMLLSEADRQFVTIESGRRSTVKFEHQIGHPLTGYVRGLENAKLRYAHVKINYLCPESQIDFDGRRSQIYTTFDVLPLAPDGRFTTDPMPPGNYLLDLFAVRTSTLEQSNHSSDFRAQQQFTVPGTGPMPQIEVAATPVAPKLITRNSDDQLLVLDAVGKPVSNFQAMLSTGSHGYTHWNEGLDGLFNVGNWISMQNAPRMDVIIRADGFASIVKQFVDADRQLMRQGKCTITLPKSRKVKVRLVLPEGMTWPRNVHPEAYFAPFQDRVKSMRQPNNRRSRDNSPIVIDFNMLNLRASAPGDFELELSESTPPFFVAIHSPGFLQHFDAGPFTLASARGGVIDIPVPRPAQLEVRFDPGAANANPLPFKGVSLSIMRELDGNAVLEVATTKVTTTKHEAKLSDLAPGGYSITVRTEPNSEAMQILGTEINPGLFLDGKTIKLQPGDHQAVDFRYEPFNPEAFKGNRTARLRFRTFDGKALANRRAKVEYYDGHFGYLTVYSGLLPASGELVLEKLTDQIRIPWPDKSFRVFIDDRRVGYFAFTKDKIEPVFDFTPLPGPGDLAPDVELTSLSTGKSVQLSQLRGKIVCLEFWASWCGPCRPAMAKLDSLNKEQRSIWQDRVAIIPVSIDNQADRVKVFLKQAGWDQLDNHWTGSGADVGFDAPAVRNFKIGGVPECILIGTDGRILWRGHPVNTGDDQRLKSRIEAALLQ